MEPCLAATGADPTVSVVLAAGLLLLGAVIAAVAIRRRKAGAALLVLALPFLVGASLLGSASPAFAQPGVPCRTPTPTPTPTSTCEPGDTLEDFPNRARWWEFFEGWAVAEVFEFEDFFFAYDVTMLALHPDAEVTAQVTGLQGNTIVNGPDPIPLDDLDPSGHYLLIPIAAYTAATDGLASGTVLVEIIYTYDIGCGLQGTSVASVAAPFGAVE